MATGPTSNPIGSEDPRDLVFNAGNLDRALHGSPEENWVDRLGNSRVPLSAITVSAQEAVEQAQTAADTAQEAAQIAQQVLAGGYQKSLSSGEIPRLTDGRTLYRFRDKVAKIKREELPDRLRIALLGSSSHEYTPIPQSLFNTIFSEFERGGEGWIGVRSSYPESVPPDDTVMVRSGWAEWDAGSQNGAVSPYPLGPDGQCMYSSTTSSTCTLTGKFTDATIYYGEVLGSFRYRVDGGAWVSVSQGSGFTIGKAEITGLSYSLHSIELDTTGNTGTAVICGFRLWRSDLPYSAEVFRMGNAGLKNIDLPSILPWIDGGAAEDFIPDLILFVLGSNDARNATSSVESFKSNVAAYLAAWKSLAPNAGVILIGPVPNGSTIDVIPLIEYVAAAYNLAIANEFDFFNMNASFGPYAAGSAFGLYADFLHLNNLGADVYVRQLLDGFNLLESEKKPQIENPDFVKFGGIQPTLYQKVEPSVLDHGGKDFIEILGLSDSAKDTLNERTGELIHTISTTKGLSVDYLRRVLEGGLMIKGDASGAIQSLMIDLISGDTGGIGLNGQNHSVNHHRDGVDVVVGALNRLTEGALFRKSDGALIGQIAPDYYTGQPVYLGIDQGPVGRDSSKIPEIKPVGAPYSSRLINLCPGMYCLPSGRIFVAYGSDYQVQHEAITNYVTIRISDDEGDTWSDLSYVVQDSTVARLIQPHFVYDQNSDVLFILLFTDNNGGSTDCQGSWVFPIFNPSGKSPRFGTPWRMLNVGEPSYPSQIDGRQVVIGELITSRSADIAQYRGNILYEVDYLKRTIDKIGQLPLSPSTDWPESSIEQLRDGSLMAVVRTATDSQMVSYNTSRNPSQENWTPWEPMAEMIGASTSSRACLKTSPQGNLLFCYNNSTSRRNMKLALLSVDGKSVIKSVTIDPMILSGDGVNTITTTYPSISFDPYGNILIAFDLGRVTYGQIWLAIVDEQDFITNGPSATVTHKVVDAAFPLP